MITKLCLPVSYGGIILAARSVLHRSTTIAVVWCAGIWNSWELARADYLFRKDTEESVRAAIRLVPDGWEYYMRLVLLDQCKHGTSRIAGNFFESQSV